MPFVARALGWERPWRTGATLREVEAGDRLVKLLECDDAALGDIEAWSRELAQAFPEARLSAALRDEAGGSMLLEVKSGALQEHVLELADPSTELALDPDGDLAFPAVPLAAQAELVVGVLEDLYGLALDALDDGVVEIGVQQLTAEGCCQALGVIAQLAPSEIDAVVCVDAVYYLASLKPARGCRLRPLKLRHADASVIERFTELAKLPTADTIDWSMPPIPATLDDRRLQNRD